MVGAIPPVRTQPVLQRVAETIAAVREKIAAPRDAVVGSGPAPQTVSVPAGTGGAFSSPQNIAPVARSVAERLTQENFESQLNGRDSYFRGLTGMDTTTPPR